MLCIKLYRLNFIRLIYIDQDEKGFYGSPSIPVNEILASIFLQVKISEHSGRGMPKIVAVHGKDSIKIEKNYSNYSF